jgi:hypothetical protein
MFSTEQEYVGALKRDWPHEREASRALLILADEAVAQFPRSSKLWCLRAALIQLGCGDAPYTLSEALESYKRALSVNPSSIEALEDIAHFYDTVMGDSSSATVYFAKAKEAKSRGGAHNV